MAAQKYDWGWVSRFKHGGAVYEEAEGFTSKVAVREDVERARAEEAGSLAGGFTTDETEVEYTIRRRPTFVPPPWEEVPG